MMEEEKLRPHDHLFKVILVGSSNVGKSALLASFMGREHADTYTATIGVEFNTKALEVDGKSIAMQVWDAAGSDNISRIARSYARAASAKFFCFDPFNRASFDAIPKWFTMMNIASPEADTYLVATHSDVNGTPEVTQEEMEALGRNVLNEKGTFRGVYRVSAKTEENIQILFNEAAQNSYMRAKREQVISAASTPTTLSEIKKLKNYLKAQIARPELKDTQKLNDFLNLLARLERGVATTAQLLEETREVASQYQPTVNPIVMAYNAFILPTSLKQLNAVFPPAPSSTPTPH